MEKKKTTPNSKSKKVKFCKHCGTEMKLSTKICPNCKKKQGIGVVKWAVIAFFALGIIGAFLDQDDESKENASSSLNDTQNESDSDLLENRYSESKNTLEENLQTNEAILEDEEKFYPRESDEIITITDTVSFWQNYSNTDMNRWYRITGRISDIGGNSFTIKDGLPDNFTAMIVCYFNDDEDLSAYRDGDTITFVGFSGNKLWDSLMIEHCFLEK